MFSGLALKADISGAQRHYRLVPTADIPNDGHNADLSVVAARHPDLGRAHWFRHAEEDHDACSDSTPQPDVRRRHSPGL